MTDEHHIVFAPSGLRIDLSAGETVLAAAQKAGVGLIAVCDGVGTCHQCIVRLVQGVLNSPTSIERQVFSDSRLVSGLRLACQAMPMSDVTIEILPDSTPTKQRLQVEGFDVDLQPDPVIDLVRRGQPLLGLALDIGTTKLAAYLVDLESGHTLAKGGTSNPQIAYGEDVISRIAYANRGAAETTKLHEVLVDGINNLVAEICQAGELDRHQILDAVAVGNTAMHHLLAGLPTRQLGKRLMNLPSATSQPAGDILDSIWHQVLWYTCRRSLPVLLAPIILLPIWPAV